MPFSGSRLSLAQLKRGVFDYNTKATELVALVNSSPCVVDCLFFSTPHDLVHQLSRAWEIKLVFHNLFLIFVVVFVDSIIIIDLQSGVSNPPW